MLRPLDYALAITLRVSDPAEFLDHRATKLFERLGDPPGDFDLRFVDSNGNRIAENSSGGALSTPSLPAIQPPLHASATLNAASGVRSDRGMTEP